MSGGITGVGDIGDLMMTMACGLVAAIVVIWLIYKMVDGDLPVLPGLVCMLAVGAVMAFAVQPPHPAVPIVALVVALALLAFYPYAASQFDMKDLRSIVAGRLDRASQAALAKPDNVNAWLEVATHLYELGYDTQAIMIADKAISGISTRVDDVQNRSLRDIYANEIRMVKRWKEHAAKNGSKSREVQCPDCQHVNPVDRIMCENCGKPYLLNRAIRAEAKPQFVVKLVVSWALLALFLVGTTALAMNLAGPMMIGGFVFMVAVVGIFIAWLFQKPKLA